MSIYYDDLLEVLSAAGIPFGLNSTTAGWERRARSSGGFASAPLGIIAHHTASSASVESDLSYMVNGSPDAPVGNMLLDRAGIVWPIAAGAANTAGKGGPVTFSRGVCPTDSGNTRTWNIEAANNGVGEPWPQVQIDTYFQCIIALNAHFGNLATDVCTHASYTSRKIDPATANAVQGPWQPTSINSSGTWSVSDLQTECATRAGSTPLPGPVPDPEDDMSNVLILEDVRNGAWYRCGPESKSWVRDGHMSAQLNARLEETAAGGVAIDGFKYTKVTNGNVDFVRSCGPIVGPRPAGVDEYGG